MERSLPPLPGCVNAPRSKGGGGLSLAAGVFARSFLLRQLVRRDFQSRYVGSALGFAWSFVQPLWQLVLFSFVFSLVLRVPMTGQPTQRFWVFLFSGLLPWLAIQEGLMRGSTAVTDNAGMVKKLRFPSEVLVLTVALSALLHQAIAGVVFVALLAALGELSWQGLPWLLLALPLQLALTVGLGLLFAAVQVFVRDLAQLLSLVLSAWFYLTPIVYPPAMIPEPYRSWIDLNPLSGLVELYRRALLGAKPAEGGAGITILALAAVGSLALGWWAFHRLRGSFVDEI
ncbi:MAG TPA: ABC transporter permease [Thermoanaerobaculia bacterium]|nr:ABC transporter permease [Thermoanaerobaculia bacterium]